jgi:hypothetical protein
MCSFFLAAAILMAAQTPAQDLGLHIEMLGDGAVQKELKLDARVVARVEAALYEMHGAVMQNVAWILEGSPKSRSEKEIYGEYQARIKRLLTPAQCRRLGELTVQRCGAKLLTVPAYAERLKLLPVQAARIAAIFEYPYAPRPLSGLPEPFEECIKALAEADTKAYRAAEKAALQLLTPKQQAEWKAMQGAPFDWETYQGRTEGLASPLSR